MKTLLKTIGIALMAIVINLNLNFNTASAAPIVKTGYFIGTAPTSPSNNLCLQNIASYIEEGWQVGFISTDISTNPAALNRPNCWRVSEMIYGPSTMFLHDATNNPTGPFSSENGGRVIWAVDWNDTVPFLASAIYFKIASTESQNSLGYSGNIATNTSGGMPLAFSPTLRGELRDTNGVLIASYHAGQDVATHPITRVIALIRVGYFVTDMTQVGLDLNYFKGHLAQPADFATTAEFYTSTFSAKDKMSSRPYVHATPFWTGTNLNIWVEGQRQLGITYNLERTLELGDGTSWLWVNSGPEGMIKDPEFDGNQYAHWTSYYRVYATAPTPPVFNKPAVAPSAPQLVVVNGPE